MLRFLRGPKRVKKTFPFCSSWPSGKLIWCIPGVGFAVQADRDIFPSLKDALDYYNALYAFSEASVDRRKQVRAG